MDRSVPWNLFPWQALQQKQGRAPKPHGPHISPHPFRPCIPASERLFFWVSTTSIAKQHKLTIDFSPQQLLTYDNALVASLAESTHSLYGSVIINWIQWCDQSNIPEHHRLPISTNDLKMYIAHKVRVEGASKTINTLAALHAWHTIQDVPWSQHDPLITNLCRAVTSKAPPSTHQDPCPPVTIAHLSALRQHLDLMSSPLDIAVFACACTSFWGVTRLGELVCPISISEPSHHVRRACQMSFPSLLPNQSHPPYLDFHIPWTKTTKSSSANIHLSEWDDNDTDISAIKALAWHLRFSPGLPDSAPLFAYASPHSSSFTPLTRMGMLKCCKQIWKAAELGDCGGHSFRIGGTTELLKRGVSHDAVKIQCHWTSDAWVLYIQHHPNILELEFSRSHARQIHGH